MELTPSLKADAEILGPLLQRLTSSSALPILLIGGHPTGSSEDIAAAHSSGTLKQVLQEVGAVIGGTEHRKKKFRLVEVEEDEKEPRKAWGPH